VGGIAPDPSASMDGWLYDEYRYSWSPDGRYLVFASMATVNNTDGGEVDVPLPIPRKGKQTGEPLILTNTTPREWTLQGVFAESSKTVTTERMAADVADKQTHSPARRNQLFVVDSRIHSVRQVTTDDSIYIDPQWSPDGKTIVCASSEGRPLYGYGPDTMNIYAIDVATGTKVALTTGPGRKWMPSWSPDGGQVAYWGGKNGMLSLYVVAAAGGEGTNVSSKRDRSVWRFAWSSDSRAIVMIYVDGVSDPIVRIELASGVVTPISEATSAVRMALTTSAVGSFAWEENGPSAPAVIRIWSPEQNASFPLVNLNPKVTDWRLGRQEVVQWKNQAGDQLEGILIYPTDYQEGRSYPLIVDAYPDTGNYFMGYPMGGNQAWASMGYAVFWPNVRAPHDWQNVFKSEAHDHAGKGPDGLAVMLDDLKTRITTPWNGAWYTRCDSCFRASATAACASVSRSRAAVSSAVRVARSPTRKLPLKKYPLLTVCTVLSTIFCSATACCTFASCLATVASADS